MLRRILIGSFLMTYLFSLCTVVRAVVEPTDLKTLTVESVAIVVAKVDDVRLVGDADVAWATVLTPFKNMQAGQKFTFMAQSTWACDTSHAIKGETVLLFLENSEPLPTTGRGEIFPKFEAEKASTLQGLPFYFIAHSGRGRIPIETDKKTEYLRVKKGIDSEINKPCLYFYGITLPQRTRSSMLPIIPYEYAADYAALRKKPVLRFLYVKFDDIAKHITTFLSKAAPPHHAE